MAVAVVSATNKALGVGQPVFYASTDGRDGLAKRYIRDVVGAAAAVVALADGVG